MRTALVCVLAFALLAPPTAQPRRTTLDIYVVDVEVATPRCLCRPRVNHC